MKRFVLGFVAGVAALALTMVAGEHVINNLDRQAEYKEEQLQDYLETAREIRCENGSEVDC